MLALRSNSAQICDTIRVISPMAGRFFLVSSREAAKIPLVSFAIRKSGPKCGRKRATGLPLHQMRQKQPTTGCVKFFKNLLYFDLVKLVSVLFVMPLKLPQTGTRWSLQRQNSSFFNNNKLVILWGTSSRYRVN